MITIALSVGQTKIGAGALDKAGTIICQADEVPTPPKITERHQAIVAQIIDAVKSVGLAHVEKVGISYPEMMEPPSRLIANPSLLTGASNPYRDSIANLLSEQLKTPPAQLPFPVEMLHDAAAAVLGEVSPMGTLAGCQDCIFIVWGTGVASGIVKDGSLYWQDPVVELMTGEIGLQVVLSPEDTYEYRPSGVLPTLNDGEVRLDQRMRGPEVAIRMRERVAQDNEGTTLTALVDKDTEEIDLIDINRAARLGNQLAVQMIVAAGTEMGRALVPFIHYWLVEREMAFAKQIVIGSGVAKLGDGIAQDREASDDETILIHAIRTAIIDGLGAAGVKGYDARGIVISKIDYEREFYAFA